MYFKIIGGICAASTSIMACVSVWAAINLIACDRQLGNDIEALNKIGLSGESDLKSTPLRPLHLPD